MSDEQKVQIDKLSRQIEISGNTIKSLEKKVADARQIIAIMEQEKKQWQQERVMQQQIIQQQLAAADAEKSRLQDEIMELRERLKNAA